jgi:hypothetical protein
LRKSKTAPATGAPFCSCSTVVYGAFLNKDAKGFSCSGSLDSWQKAKSLLTTVYSHLLILSGYNSLSVYFAGRLNLLPNAKNND